MEFNEPNPKFGFPVVAHYQNLLSYVLATRDLYLGKTGKYKVGDIFLCKLNTSFFKINCNMIIKSKISGEIDFYLLGDLSQVEMLPYNAVTPYAWI